MSDVESDESEGSHSSTDETHTGIPKSRSHSAASAPRLRVVPARFGHMRPFQHVASLSRSRYRSVGRRMPPPNLLTVLEGDDAALDSYEQQLKSQLLALFDVLLELQLPSQMDDLCRSEPDPGRRVSTTGSAVQARADMGVRKGTPSGKSQTKITQSANASTHSATNDAIVEDIRFHAIFDSAMDAAESLMMLEDLNWSGLFHLRFVVTNRLLVAAEVEQTRALAEQYLAGYVGSKDDVHRKTASKLMQYLVSHAMDPDGALLGLRCNADLEQRSVKGFNALEHHDKIVGWTAEGAAQPLGTSALSHGMLLLANMEQENPPGQLTFVRFSRVDPTRTHCVHVWTGAHEKDTVVLDCKWGVFALDDESKSKLGADASQISKLLHNPLSVMHAELAQLMSDHVDTYLRDGGCDMFLVGLTEAALLADNLDLSRYGLTRESGQELCTKLLSLFDVEKKRLAALRAALKREELDGVAAAMSRIVDAHLARLNPHTLFAPVRAVEIETARGLAQRVLVTFQHTIDLRLAQIEVPIHFIIVNWKKLSDPKARKELKQSDAATRTPTLSRGSLKAFMAGGSKSDLQSSSGAAPGSPMAQRPGTPSAVRPPTLNAPPVDSPKQKMTLRTLFSGKKE